MFTRTYRVPIKGVIARRFFCVKNIRERVKERVKDIPNIIDMKTPHSVKIADIPADTLIDTPYNKYFVETYGWQMNFADTEVVQAMLESAGFQRTDNSEEANVVFANTWAIREKAETKVWNKIKT